MSPAAFLTARFLRHVLQPVFAPILVLAVVIAATLRAQDGYVFSTLAGKAGDVGNADGSGASARFNGPRSLAVGSDGAIYVGDMANSSIRKIVVGTDVMVSTVTINPAGTGDDDQSASSTRISPAQLAVASDGSLVILDTTLWSVRKLKNGTLSTLRAYATPPPGGTGNVILQPGGGFVVSLAIAPGGTIYVGGQLAGTTSTGAGFAVERLKPDGSVLSPALTLLGMPRALAADGADGLVVVEDATRSVLRLSTSGERTVVTSAQNGAADGLGNAASFNFTPFASPVAQFNAPNGLAGDVNHNTFVADTLNNTIRRITPDGYVTTIGGVAGQPGDQDGIGAMARFRAPAGIAVDAAGVLYVADYSNHTIRKGVPAYLPKFVTQPQGGAVKLGEAVALSATVAANTLTTTYQWQKDGVAITGATNATLAITSAAVSDAGTYAIVATNDLGSVASSVANLTVEVPAASRIVNVAIRTGITTTAPMVTVGFVVGGGSKPLLVRTGGPKLKEYGVGDAIADPKLALFRGDTQVAANDNWSSAANASDVAAAATQVGAFALANGAADAALLTTLNGSAYTVQATGVGGATGTALVEVYDVDPASGGRLINVSSRAQVGTGDNVLMAGFAVSGTAKKALLIRAVGPTLASSFGVAGALSDPKIELIPSGGTTAIATNDNWAGDPVLAVTFASVGAFPFNNIQSKDAALVVTVPPGSYSAKVSGVNGATGEALVEIYELP